MSPNFVSVSLKIFVVLNFRNIKYVYYFVWNVEEMCFFLSVWRINAAIQWSALQIYFVIYDLAAEKFKIFPVFKILCFMIYGARE
jgi:hypothetical protein